jgi:glycine/D-amino acid oxidase-like deaminating enzyme/nitrite reductase/ring-hydroxylating ferredoxin subunit
MQRATSHNNAHTESIWTTTAESPKLDSLQGDMSVDVAIVGAGITGLTAAALLKKAGKKVVVLERETFGRHGTTHRTTAHATVALDQSYRTLIRKFNQETVQHAVNASNAAIDWIEAAATEFGFDNEFVRVDGYFYAEGDQNAGDVEDDFEAAIKLGIPAEMVSRLPLPVDFKSGYRIPRQGQFHPVKHLNGLAEFVNGDGCHVFHQTHVRDFKDGGDAGPCTLKTDHGTITARDVILATHTPMGVWASLQTRLVPLMSYVIAARVKNQVPVALFWDNADPYNYVRRFSADDKHLLIIGGADTKTGSRMDTDKSFAALERFAREHFEVEAIETRWSAQFFEPADGLPYIGLGPGTKHTYVATGYSGTGTTYGTAAAMLITDLILRRDPANPWAEVFKPSRLKPIASAKHVLEEAAVSLQGLIGDRLFKMAGRDIEAIPRGEGRLITADGERLAVYRDENGTVSAVSPVCTHLGCMVEWNNAEKGWDCKCHGSRFDTSGEVIDGPATAPLKKKAIEASEETAMRDRGSKVKAARE